MQSSKVCGCQRCKVWLGVVHSSSVMLCVTWVVVGDVPLVVLGGRLWFPVVVTSVASGCVIGIVIILSIFSNKYKICGELILEFRESILPTIFHVTFDFLIFIYLYCIFLFILMYVCCNVIISFIYAIFFILFWCM